MQCKTWDSIEVIKKGGAKWRNFATQLPLFTHNLDRLTLAWKPFYVLPNKDTNVPVKPFIKLLRDPREPSLPMMFGYQQYKVSAILLVYEMFHSTSLSSMVMYSHISPASK